MSLDEVINYSEFNTLTDCERRFVYAYLLFEEEEGHKRGLHLGTLCHLWHSSWLQGNGAVLLDTWTDDINTGGKPGEVRTLCLSDFEPELVERARWLAKRFVEHYGERPPSSWTVISAEEWMTRDFDGFTLVGRSDGWVDIEGLLTLVEVKSYGSRPGPLAYAQVSPQLGCYSLLAEEKYGQLPDQVLYQGIHTYQWKRKPMTLAAITEWATTPDDQGRILMVEHEGVAVPFTSLNKADQRAWVKSRQPSMLQPERDPSESFQQLELVLGEQHLAVAQQYLEAAVDRRRYLIDGDPGGVIYQETPLERALPNIGQSCRSCGFKRRCWFELGGVEEFEIELEEEDDEQEPV